MTLDLAGCARLKHLALVADRVTCVVRPHDEPRPDDARHGSLIDQHGRKQSALPKDGATSRMGTSRSGDPGGGGPAGYRDAKEQVGGADMGVSWCSGSMGDCGTLEGTQCGTTGGNTGTTGIEHGDMAGTQDAAVSVEGPELSSSEQPAAEHTIPSGEGTLHGTQTGYQQCSGRRDPPDSGAVAVSIPADWLWRDLRPGHDIPRSLDTLSKDGPVGVLTGVLRGEEGVRVAAGWRYKFGPANMLDLDAVPCELYDELERGCSF